ncbi:recombinase family protein [Anaerosporobacter sp.]|uniref:recombinase family protein n=1 Tax=Anaerosporobacter sp. TaxID=1872529 RepID=UPI00286ED3D0|nr:recombinase family protein [Anaerosporobacter sp.]
MKAVYYARVSTDEESQVDALKNQKKEAENCILNNGWNLVDRYVDEGRSGTTTKKRDEYNRLCEDMAANTFDIIVVKSQDRLMRNTKEWYIFVDKLVSNNKKLFFYIENKFYTPDDALITGIKAILAEEYSRELSKKINNAHRNRQRNGSNVVITSATWGYDKVNKEIVINEEEAKIVRLIYEMYASGLGSRSISKNLTNMGIYNRKGGYFADGVIRDIVKNPIYKGTVIMNKSHYDFNSKRTIRTDESEWIIHENIVPAIVSNELWDKANKTINRNLSEIGVANDAFKRRIGVNRGQYDLSGKIVCGECGNVYWRKFRRIKAGIVIDWSCSEYISKGRRTAVDKRSFTKIKVEKQKDCGCDNITINEEKLYDGIKEIAQNIFSGEKDEYIKRVLKIMQKSINSKEVILDSKNIDKEIEKIKTQKDFILDKLLDGIISDEDYKRKDISLESRLSELKSQKLLIESRMKSYADEQERIKLLIDKISDHGTEDINKNSIMEYIDEITVYNDHLDVSIGLLGNMRLDIVGGLKSKKYLYVE